MEVNRSCYNDIVAFLDGHAHDAVDAEGVPTRANIVFCAGPQLFVVCATCGMVQTADEIDAGNVALPGSAFDKAVLS